MFLANKGIKPPSFCIHMVIAVLGEVLSLEITLYFVLFRKCGDDLLSICVGVRVVYFYCTF